MTFTIPIAACTTLAYGILAIVGGVIGYKQAGSQVPFYRGLSVDCFCLLAHTCYLPVAQLGQPSRQLSVSC